MRHAGDFRIGIRGSFGTAHRILGRPGRFRLGDLDVLMMLVAAVFGT